MGKNEMKKKKPKNLLTVMTSAILLTLCIACFLQVTISARRMQQMPLVLNRFEGSYSYDGIHWQPITEQDMPSGKHNNVVLRGHFVNEVPEGRRLYYYRNHIAVSIYRNGEPILSDWDIQMSEQRYRMTVENCGREWRFIVSPGITPEDTLEILLQNPHRYVNQTPYRDFLSTLYVGNGSTNVLENMLQNRSFFSAVVGIVLCVLSIMLFGITAAARLLHIREDLHLASYALASLFCGIFMLADMVDVSFWSTLTARNTYLRQLSMILAAFFSELTLCEMLTGTRKRIAAAAIICSAVADAILVLLAVCKVMAIFDTQPYWAISQLVLCLLLIVCGVHELACNAKYRRYEAVLVVLLPIAVILDLAQVWRSVYSSANFSRIALGLTFLYCAGRAVYSVSVNHNAVTRAENLEKELAESRISIMLSQLQPHFMYNVLNSIYYLCKRSPEDAREMVDKFSEYLRNNMSFLEKKELIPFGEEYQHVQAYLELERLRFPDTLKVVCDIETMRFRLPPLTVQPLVENAVRHGVTKKKGGGTVTISVREAANSFLVKVEDTGCGFDPEHYMDDGRVHIGIRNVRERLDRIVGGTLTIESTPDVGTTAIITIPRKEGMLV